MACRPAEAPIRPSVIRRLLTIPTQRSGRIAPRSGDLGGGEGAFLARGTRRERTRQIVVAVPVVHAPTRQVACGCSVRQSRRRSDQS